VHVLRGEDGEHWAIAGSAGWLHGSWAAAVDDAVDVAAGFGVPIGVEVPHAQRLRRQRFGSEDKLRGKARDMDYDPVNDAFRELEDAVYNCFKVRKENCPETITRKSELERRQDAVQYIQEILDFKPLDRYQAEHLEYLVLLLCYWRELEDGGHGGDDPDKKPLVKGPDPLQ
jgi:hypothetical protein